MSFLDVEISRDTGKLVTFTFNGVYTHFEKFSPAIQKFGMLYTLVHRCVDWTNFHRNYYPKSFIDKYFKKFLDRLHVIKPTLATVEKKPLRLVLIYLGRLLYKSEPK